jgi:hypothetical protein
MKTGGIYIAGKSKYGGKFCSPNERQITTLGTGYIANFISGGSAEKAGATLTNKRIYFSGNTFSFNDKGQLTSIKAQKIVNVRDVTGVGYTMFSPIQYIIYAVVALVVGVAAFAGTGSTDLRGVWSSADLGFMALGIGAAVAIICIVYFNSLRKSLLCIEYAGGNIAFEVRWFKPDEQDNFIRNIHLAKDKLYSRAAVEQGFVEASEPEPEPEP